MPMAPIGLRNANHVLTVLRKRLIRLSGAKTRHLGAADRWSVRCPTGATRWRNPPTPHLRGSLVPTRLQSRPRRRALRRNHL